MDLWTIFIHDTDWNFIGELLLRCLIMYTMIIVFLRLTGKRGVRQLSIFEVAIILALGSIAGDPMFDETLPLIQAFIVMSVIILLYRLTTYLTMKYQPFEDLLEGKPLYIVEDGMMVLRHIAQGKMSHDEFFAEMRQQGAEHLGQIRTGLLESDGKFSILFYSPEEVRYGLPLFPKDQKIIKEVEPHTYYACLHCGNVVLLSTPDEICQRCYSCKWILALNTQRQT
ncbi:DUF421 domain-containing protein [Acinetobacter sp. HR7]|uniref:DUF421 domain-containing protein n=1 Tax=Acinetobacter sp. HR7 TaxID=1509403 RepID=UPI0005377840|nr:YetF domain-containing protein [Acinetobacter sp. HR7]KGT47606.1 hypothetical protein GW12_13320 [Acinetobacter sp. HR7]